MKLMLIDIVLLLAAGPLGALAAIEQQRFIDTTASSFANELGVGYSVYTSQAVALPYCSDGWTVVLTTDAKWKCAKELIDPVWK